MLFLNYQIGREDKIICNFKTIILKSVLINGGKDEGMKLKKKIGRKIAALTLAVAMAVGGYMSVFAATGFTVSNPSLSVIKDKYFVTGGMSYYSTGSSTSYYLLVEVKGVIKAGGRDIIYTKPGYGYGKASATTDEISLKPWYMENKGSYNSGSGFTVVDVKKVYN